MSRTAYYERMKALALETRSQYDLEGPRVGLSELRGIYRQEGIRIDLWPYKLKKLRGAYFHDTSGASVLLAKGLPTDPRAFTMAHELKHHLVDQALLVSCCDASNQNALIEIGAEVFAAEFLFPEQDFIDRLDAMGAVAAACTAQHLVRLKYQTKTTLSYSGLAKRAEFIGLAPVGSFKKVKFKKLEEKMYGLPFRRRR